MAQSPIVDPDELAARSRMPTMLDARSGPGAFERYRQGHLRGAFFCDLETDLSGDASDPSHGGRHPLPALSAWCRRLGLWGITPHSDVVIYDDKGGINAAARAWWMLRAAGHEKVSVLDGGFDSAIAAGLAVERDEPTLLEQPAYPATAWRMPIATMEDVQAAISDPTRRVVDVRAADRYEGTVEPFDPRPGHIAGAINLPCSENLDRGRFRSGDELSKMLDVIAAEPSRTIVSCGSGVTACHTLLAMEIAGRPGAALYVGSYGEWVRRGGPVEP